MIGARRPPFLDGHAVVDEADVFPIVAVLRELARVVVAYSGSAARWGWVGDGDFSEKIDVMQRHRKAES
jgi:hypothetical protein